MSTMTLPPLCFQDAQWHYPQTTSSPPASLHSPRHLCSSAWYASPIWDSPPRATGSPRSNVDRNIWSPGAVHSYRSAPSRSGYRMDPLEISAQLARLSILPPPPSAQGSPSGAFADRYLMRGHAPPAPRSTSSFNPFEDDDAPSLMPSRFQSTVGRLSSSFCPASQPTYPASPPIKVPSLPLLDLNSTSGAGTAQIQTPSVVRLADDPMTISIPSAEPSSLDPRGDVARTLLTRGNKHRARTARCDEPRYYQKSSLSAVIHG
ncbi:hypothetical protein BDZ89DRAFT_1125646 [Hymenopellis radicata]|nr:hypothetical protein BDZ89DRAFT_1125646 [Hymenopellis radicata]